MCAHTMTIDGDGGDEIEAYLARPDGRRAARRRGRHPPHARLRPGDQGDRPAVRRARLRRGLPEPVLARGARRRRPTTPRPPPAPTAACPTSGWSATSAGAAALPAGAARRRNGKVGVIGYCSGGRQCVLAACSLDLDAAVDCYGAFVTGTPPEGFPLKVTTSSTSCRDLRCPLLGLFGEEDTYPSPEQVAELDEILTAHGKTYEFHSYDDAGHAFFAVDRPVLPGRRPPTTAGSGSPPSTPTTSGG